MSINPADYLGKDTMKKMQETKWYALARMLEEILYAGSVGPDPKYEASKRFITSDRVCIGDFPSWVKILGREGSSVDVQKGLRELASECERMAIKEVT